MFVQTEPRHDEANAAIHPASGVFMAVRADALADGLTWLSPPVEAVIGTLPPGRTQLRRREQQDLLVTKAIRGSDEWIDHRFVISKMRIHHNHQQMHFQSPVSTTTVHELVFVGGCVLNATSEGDMQRCTYLCAAACDNFDLIISAERTMVMHQPPPNAAYNAPHINVNGV
nr:unnamed protein product [Spirometra erinaceieuropaei]